MRSSRRKSVAAVEFQAWGVGIRLAAVDFAGIVSVTISGGIAGDVARTFSHCEGLAPIHLPQARRRFGFNVDLKPRESVTNRKGSRLIPSGGNPIHPFIISIWKGREIQKSKNMRLLLSIRRTGRQEALEHLSGGGARQIGDDLNLTGDLPVWQALLAAELPKLFGISANVLAWR